MNYHPDYKAYRFLYADIQTNTTYDGIPIVNTEELQTFAKSNDSSLSQVDVVLLFTDLDHGL